MKYNLDPFNTGFAEDIVSQAVHQTVKDAKPCYLDFRDSQNAILDHQLPDGNYYYGDVTIGGGSLNIYVFYLKGFNVAWVNEGATLQQLTLVFDRVTSNGRAIKFADLQFIGYKCST